MRRLGPPALIAAFLLLSGWTWNTWADPLVDFGRELETATRLAGGELLYRDVAYLNGPLSPYLNAVVLRVGGASLRTLFSFNLLVLFACAALLWGITRRLAGDLSALVCTALLIGLCGFLTLGEVGNYNFIAPYSHEMTHGLTLALAALRLLLSLLHRPRAGVAGLLGVVTGLTVLTKPEIAIAATGAVAAGVLLATRTHVALPGSTGVQGSTRGTRVLAVAVAGTALPLLLAWGLLHLGGLSGVEAGRGLIGAWPGTFDGALHRLPFYRTVAGTIDLPRAWSLVVLSAAAWTGLAMAGALAGLLAARLRWSPWWVGGVLATGFVLLAWLLTSPGHWQVAFRGLGLLTLSAIVAHAIAWRRSGGSNRVARIAFCLFALLLLAKVRFNVGLAHYGFVLALPAACVLAMALLDWLPRWLERRGGSGTPTRVLALAAFACVFVVYLGVAGTFLRDRVPIAEATANELWVPRGRAASITGLLTTIAAAVPPDATLAIVPEGALIHAWTGLRSSLPFTTLMPVEMHVLGEDAVLSSFQRSPPDFVVLNRGADLAAYGHDSLPSYAPRLAAWLREHYEDASPRGLDDAFLLLRRRGSP